MMNLVKVREVIESRGGVLFGSRAWVPGWDDHKMDEAPPFIGLSAPTSTDFDYMVQLEKYVELCDIFRKDGLVVMDHVYFASSCYIHTFFIKLCTFTSFGGIII